MYFSASNGKSLFLTVAVFQLGPTLAKDYTDECSTYCFAYCEDYKNKEEQIKCLDAQRSCSCHGVFSFTNPYFLFAFILFILTIASIISLCCFCYCKYNYLKKNSLQTGVITESIDETTRSMHYPAVAIPVVQDIYQSKSDSPPEYVPPPTYEEVANVTEKEKY